MNLRHGDTAAQFFAQDLGMRMLAHLAYKRFEMRWLFTPRTALS